MLEYKQCSYSVANTLTEPKIKDSIHYIEVIYSPILIVLP
jgi:hypothetical protein